MTFKNCSLGWILSSSYEWLLLLVQLGLNCFYIIIVHQQNTAPENNQFEKFDLHYCILRFIILICLSTLIVKVEMALLLNYCLFSVIAYISFLLFCLSLLRLIRVMRRVKKRGGDVRRCVQKVKMTAEKRGEDIGKRRGEVRKHTTALLR